MKKITTSPLHSLEDTQAVATALAATLVGGDRLGLDGQLGAGKTTFTQLLAAALGVRDYPDSPTFVLRQAYPVPNHPSITHLVHFDLYRLAEPVDLSALGELGLQDDWLDPNAIVIVEWVNKAPALLAELTHHLVFQVNHQTGARELQLEERRS